LSGFTNSKIIACTVTHRHAFFLVNSEQMNKGRERRINLVQVCILGQGNQSEHVVGMPSATWVAEQNKPTKKKRVTRKSIGRAIPVYRLQN
jgi:hypothetical protein